MLNYSSLMKQLELISSWFTHKSLYRKPILDILQRYDCWDEGRKEEKNEFVSHLFVFNVKGTVQLRITNKSMSSMSSLSSSIY